jgi:putative chitinase
MSLRMLQERVGVTPDGVFGPRTLRASKLHYKMTPLRAAHFFAQCAHETGNFRLFSENLNYNASGLLNTFRRHFPDAATANRYARQPERIANRVYANRMGNGNPASGDGWRFRGRGALQLTGRNNYQLFSEYLKDPEVMKNPDLVAGRYAFESALFFFDTNKLWSICDRGVDNNTITTLTRRINGGTNGLADRIEKTRQYARMLGII